MKWNKINSLLNKKGLAMNGIILVGIGVVIAIAMIPVIVQTSLTVTGANNTANNLSGSELLLLGLVTLIFVAGLIALIVKKWLGSR